MEEMTKTSYRYMKLRKSIDTTTTRTGKCLKVIDLVEYGMFGDDFHQQPKPKCTQNSVWIVSTNWPIRSKQMIPCIDMISKKVTVCLD